MDAENKRKTRLQKLSGSDFEIVDGQPDIRGWDVKDAAGKQLGEVDELIFDYESRKVRYLVVDLGDNDYNSDNQLEDKEVLVPIGIAELHENDDDVILPGVTMEQLLSLPVYDEDRFDTEHETNVRNVFGGLGAGTLTEDSILAGESGKSDDFYNHDHFNEANLYRNRVRKDEKTPYVLPEDLKNRNQEVETNTNSMYLRSRIVEEDTTSDTGFHKSDKRINPDDDSDEEVHQTKI